MSRRDWRESRASKLDSLKGGFCRNAACFAWGPTASRFLDPGAPETVPPWSPLKGSVEWNLPCPAGNAGIREAAHIWTLKS